ncbi:Predicted ATPase [Raineyella antarctica]|uniref:Predicted ATPase n=1 Tax=Raineyella antarctica TaxID=1577474 RepID=A0A1G6GEQ4_9ACTN|nr:LuxR C-terminal-related transcriptional regulator [Raineyella antarctica]SDB80492.1 Predicted ATPase [Raineyella antarctica]
MTDPTPQMLATPLTSFVGRRELLHHAEQVVREQRLVTLVGPGGIGKTRLSMVLADALRTEFLDGVIMVALDAVQDPAGVAWRVASAVHSVDQSIQDPLAQVIRQLRERRVLLLVDNCEHVLEAAADLVMAVLRDCPQVHVLATSIEPLGISGERVVSVPPLQLPVSCADLEAVRHSEAVHLLVERAAQAGVDLDVTPANCRQVIELCEHLDGMPLAIELAAARLRSLTVGDLLERLGHRFAVLKGSSRDLLPRHRTLEALVDWTYELCSPAEQLLWSRLAVFRGGSDLEAAEAVCGFGSIDPVEVLDLLDGLVAKSVVVAVVVEGQAYYRQLVTMRDYGERVAERHGEWEELRRRHALLHRDRGRRMHTEWVGPHQAAWLRRARRDYADIVASMDWGTSTPDGHDVAAETAANLRYFWASGYNMSAGRYRLERVLALPDVAPSLRCECLLVISWVSLLQGDHTDAPRYLAEAQALATELGDRRRLAEVQTWTGLVHFFTGDAAGAVPYYQRGIAELREVGDVAARQAAMFQLALCQIYSGDPAAGGATCEEILEESRRDQEAWVKAYALWVAGIVRWRQGDLAGVREYATAALRLQQVFQDAICTAHLMLLVGQVVMAAGEVRRAARLQGAADALWVLHGTGIDAFGPGLAGDARESRERLFRVLGRTEAGTLMAESAGVDVPRAIALALAELDRLEVSQHGGEVGLTRREAQVAELLAEGLSNKQIAGRLTISTRTVDGHVERILAKFGVTSRSQVAVRLRETEARA